jgi:hypothetical protein
MFQSKTNQIGNTGALLFARSARALACFGPRRASRIPSPMIEENIFALNNRKGNFLPHFARS